jgi:hypothetical protein
LVGLRPAIGRCHRGFDLGTQVLQVLVADLQTRDLVMKRDHHHQGSQTTGDLD